MNVVPGLSRTAGFVHSDCAVLIKVPSVKGEEGPEQRILGVVVTAVRDVNAADKANKPPPPGAIPEVGVADDSLLVMSVERGHKLATESKPASLPPGDVCANHVSSLHKREIRNCTKKFLSTKSSSSNFGICRLCI